MLSEDSRGKVLKQTIFLGINRVPTRTTGDLYGTRFLRILPWKRQTDTEAAQKTHVRCGALPLLHVRRLRPGEETHKNSSESECTADQHPALVGHHALMA